MRKEVMITHEMAENIVRCVAGSFAAEMPAGGYTEMELCSLARKLSFMLDADVRFRALGDVVEKVLELCEVDRGTHDDLDVSRDGTIDNRDSLVQCIESECLDLVEFVLMQAGFRPHVEVAA